MSTEQAMRTNPEVMGRNEPVVMEQPRAVETEFWPDMSDFRRRFDEIQSEFIEEPRHAVKKAERLIDDAIDHVTKTMRERIQRVRATPTVATTPSRCD